MRAVDVIRTKRDGGVLSREAIGAFVTGVCDGSWPEYQAAALLMAIVWRGMSGDETAALTEAMVASGARIDLSTIDRPRVDKHSTGGVGDKTSLIVAPVVAACGACVPMMSGRGLGHTGGTLDKLEAIPGFRTSVEIEVFRDILRRVGCAIIGQTAQVAPADRVLYALRDVTATVDSIPLITASIMSKKIAEGIGALVLDVKAGQGAFMTNTGAARELARMLVATGRANGVRTEALITAMDAPLGCAIGNALEVREAIATLRGDGPPDVEEVSLALAARMLVVSGVCADEPSAAEAIRAALTSGRALERFAQMVEAQGGDPGVVDRPDVLPAAPFVDVVTADGAGVVQRIDALALGRAAVGLGAGRERVGDAVDPAVGLVLKAGVGDRLVSGQPVCEIHARDAGRRDQARADVRAAFTLGDGPASRTPLILERLTA